MEENSSSECENVSNEQKSRKKKVTGRLRNVKKKVLEASHEIGPDCKCVRYKCFQALSDLEKKCIINQYNKLTVNEQNAYLYGLVIVFKVRRRRSRNINAEEQKLHDCSYAYRVRVHREDQSVDIRVCQKAFISLHGITKKKVEVIQKYLKDGVQPKDRRGQHKNRKHALSEETFLSVCAHIGSFKGHKSHYGLKDSQKLYLPVELNVRKMCDMYNREYPENNVSYEKYRNIFNENFNISFGVSRLDTCSTCDRFEAQIRTINNNLQNVSNDNKQIQFSKEQRIKVEDAKKCHIKEASVFYDRKTSSRKNSKHSSIHESIAMDYQKNLHLPNITTNDVYYKRQLTMCMFNIHTLSNNQPYFYAYDETIACKGADEVASFLCYFIMVQLDSKVKHLDIFCDSCCGQNKNWTIIRLVHYFVHYTGRLDSVKMTFPIRGHSYLECDRNMAVINQKRWAELPEDWIEEFRCARTNPSPFNVTEIDRSMVRQWTIFLSPLYKKQCPFKIRSVKELIVEKDETRQIKCRSTYYGHFSVYDITSSEPSVDCNIQFGEFKLPPVKYEGPIPVSFDKFTDLQCLKEFCGAAAQEFYTSLPKMTSNPKSKKRKRQNEILTEFPSKIPKVYNEKQSSSKMDKHSKIKEKKLIEFRRTSSRLRSKCQNNNRKAQ